MQHVRGAVRPTLRAAGLGAALLLTGSALRPARPVDAVPAAASAAWPAPDHPFLHDLRGAAALRPTEAGQALAAALTAADRAAALRSFTGQHPGMRDWATLLALEPAVAAADTTGVRVGLAEVEPTLAAEWGWRLTVRAFDAAGDRRGAAAAALRAAGSTAVPELRAAALVAAAGRTGERAYYREAMAAAPGSSHAVTAARELGALRDADEEDLRAAGTIWLRHGNLARGVAGVEAWLNAGRGSPEERAAARLELAQAHVRTGAWAEAERRALRAVADPLVPAARRAEALVLAGRAAIRADRMTAGRASLARAVAEHADEPAVAEAHWILGDLAHDAGHLDAAREHYRGAVRLDPGGAHGGEAAMRLAGLAWLAGDHAEAARILEGYRGAASGERLQQASYWAGLAYEAVGDTARARARLREAHEVEPASYYGMEALERLGEPPWHLHLAASPPADAAFAAAAGGALARQAVLRGAGLTEAAAYEAGRTRRFLATIPDALYALAEEHHARGETFSGISVGREIRRGAAAWNARLLRVVYPFPWQEAVEAEARAAGVDPYLVAGLIRQESMFDPGAVSSAGAVGLMQVMPATARAMGPRLGIRNAQGRLKEPEVNLLLGVRALADHLRRYDGRMDELLVAYNAGSGRLARWRAHPEHAVPALFAERIPFAETREYVRTVQQNARIYRALYGAPAGDEPRNGAERSSME